VKGCAQVSIFNINIFVLYFSCFIFFEWKQLHTQLFVHGVSSINVHACNL